jgi:hypothetical protein
MSKFAVFDQNGLPLGFYSPEISPVIPPGAVALTEAQWQEFLDHQGKRKWDGAKVVPFVPPVVPTTPEQLRKDAFAADVTLQGFRKIINDAQSPAELRAKVATLTAAQKTDLVLQMMIDYVATGRG